jgi:hypothetical protein
VDPASLEEAARGGLEAGADWAGLGLALAIVGCFLLATAILSRSPRDLIEERLGGGRPALRTIREPIAGRAQLLLGFVFLMAGFGLQLYARYRAPLGAQADAAGSGAFPAFWIGLLVVCAALCSLLGWWWSAVSFRRHLAAYLREHPPDFETDTRLAREVGELFGVTSQPEDTVETYVARLRERTGLAARPAPSAARLDPGLEGEGDLGDVVVPRERPRGGAREVRNRA